MAKLFNRTYALTLHDAQVTKLHVEFDVTKTRSKEPNKGSILVYNLSEERRKALSETKNPVIMLEAGYEDRTALLFKGKATRVLSMREGADWKTEIQLGDGAVEIAKANVQIRFPPGTSLENVVRSLVQKTGLAPGNLVKMIKEKGPATGLTQFVKGFSASGSANEIIDKLARSVKVNSSVQDEQYDAAPIDGTSARTAYSLSAATGLVGSPELGDDGTIKVTTLLLPDVKPNDPIMLEAASIKGRFRVEKVQHVGSYRGADWYSRMDLKQVKS